MENVLIEDKKKFLNQISELGYPGNYEKQWDAKVKHDTGSCMLIGESPIFHGQDEVNFSFFIKTIKTDDGVEHKVLGGTSAELTRDIKIPELVVGDLITTEFEKRLINPPLPPVKEDEETLRIFDQKIVDYNIRIEKDLSLLLEASPATFSKLIVKYDLPFPHVIPDEVQKQIEEIGRARKEYANISSYFNVSAIELHGLLEGRHVSKKLFPTKKGDIEQNNSLKASKPFSTYIKIKTGSVREDGFCEMEFAKVNGKSLFEVLQDYNLEESTDKNTRMQAAYALNRGMRLLVHNKNDLGIKEAFAEAYPNYDMKLKFFTLDGTLIPDQRPFLKNPLVVAVSEYAELKPMTKETEGKLQNYIREEPLPLRRNNSSRIVNDESSRGLKI